MKSLYFININNRKWSVRFLPRSQMREGDFGTCWSLKRAIDILDELDKEETKIILTHELAHAFLTACGDVHQEQYNEEKVCDFIGWNIDNIIQIREKIVEERFNETN